jgi:hypothetical protein
MTSVKFLPGFFFFFLIANVIAFLLVPPPPSLLLLLKNKINHIFQDALHAKLADVLTLMGKPADALAHYHTALSLHPNNAEAKTGLERLEKVKQSPSKPPHLLGRIDAQIKKEKSWHAVDAPLLSHLTLLLTFLWFTPIPIILTRLSSGLP